MLDKRLHHKGCDAGKNSANHPFQDKKIGFNLSEAAVVIGNRLRRSARFDLTRASVEQSIIKFHQNSRHDLSLSTQNIPENRLKSESYKEGT